MTSVFVSAFNHDYLQFVNNDNFTHAKYRPTGAACSIIANRVSWFFDLKAASLLVDTACSSSMAAIHLGCQNLKNGESEMAIVSGVSLTLWPKDFMAMCHHGFLSPDGKSYSFDHRANGYGRGEGVSTIILKR
jgi:acyl transferase domain-containing protein